MKEQSQTTQAKQSEATMLEESAMEMDTSRMKGLNPPPMDLSASGPVQMQQEVVQRSSLSDELSKIWNDQGKGAFYEHVRNMESCIADPDVYQWANDNLVGDDLWLTLNLLSYGRESGWPLHLQIEREMKGWGDCGGRDEVMNLIRAKAATMAGNATVIASIHSLFPTQSLDRWLARTLLEKGDESLFDQRELIIKWYLENNELTALTEIEARGIDVVSFVGAFDRWELVDGTEEITDLSARLRGNSAGTTIRLNAALSASDAATTLFHEVQHQVVDGLAYLDEEIEVRRRTEQMAIDTGLPETRAGYRNADGTINQQAIDDSVRNSSHYNPTGRTRVERWYEGEANMGSWTLP